MNYCFTCVSLPVYKGIMGNTFLCFLPECNVNEEFSTVGVRVGDINSSLLLRKYFIWFSTLRGRFAQQQY